MYELLWFFIGAATILVTLGVALVWFLYLWAEKEDREFYTLFSEDEG